MLGRDIRERDLGDRTPLEAGESVSGAFIKTFTVRAGIIGVVLVSRFVTGRECLHIYSLVSCMN